MATYGLRQVYNNMFEVLPFVWDSAAFELPCLRQLHHVRTRPFLKAYTKLEFQRTHTLCALSMQSLARAAITAVRVTALQLLVTEPEIPSAAYITAQKVGVYKKVSKTRNVYKLLQVVYNMLTTL